MKNKNTTLTELETQILTLLFKDAEGNGHDFGIIENLVDYEGIDMKVARGVLSSLVKKDIITVHEYRFEMGMEQGCTQFTWNHVPADIYPESITHVLPENVTLGVAA
jgi:hypothetical protein